MSAANGAHILAALSLQRDQFLPFCSVWFGIFCLVFVFFLFLFFFKEKNTFMHKSPLGRGLHVARNKITHFCVCIASQRNISVSNAWELSVIVSLF